MINSIVTSLLKEKAKLLSISECLKGYSNAREIVFTVAIGKSASLFCKPQDLYFFASLEIDKVASLQVYDEKETFENEVETICPLDLIYMKG